MMLVSFLLAALLPATASPLAGLHELVGSWSCTYRAGGAPFAYDATYAYERDGHVLREVATWTGGGDEELVTYDAQRHGWTAVVLDDGGTVTVMRGTGDPHHITYRSVYPDDSIAERFDRVSQTEYTLRATVRMHGKTTASVDTCLRR